MLSEVYLTMDIIKLDIYSHKDLLPSAEYRVREIIKHINKLDDNLKGECLERYVSSLDDILIDKHSSKELKEYIITILNVLSKNFA